MKVSSILDLRSPARSDGIDVVTASRISGKDLAVLEEAV